VNPASTHGRAGPLTAHTPFRFFLTTRVLQTFTIVHFLPGLLLVFAVAL
jgi:hypothetical protein